MFGRYGSPPVAIKIWSAVTCSFVQSASVTSMVWESTNFPKPLITSILFFANIKNEEGCINLPHLRDI